ncbi:hypothetical protein FOI68_20490 [Brevibacillus sp. LEMMJ03]|mgnify:CR=1 FL=1|uniref:hypothetical protein n=1 Tax=Brevibacillus sp. LEMMJ03 TaxID=2595056 RepID=UPI00117CD6F1|nr:hypothetical protein [Brevibacillus sp. LEMMJ03]TRY23650.1 hypothetical protein FOI68_20490 [Brevibacillus sp. LEMMJ03]
MKGYDFKAARRRIEELKLIYRQMKRWYEDDDTWSWWIMAQIEEIEREIEEAHQAQKGRMAVGQDGHPINAFGNVLTPIIPAWSRGSKEDLQHV